MYDVIVIGAGPSGITSSIYVKRANLKVLVLYFSKPDLEKAEKIENYYGFENGITGYDLYNKGIAQAKKLGVEVKKEEVLDIQKKDNIFNIKTEKEEYLSKAVIIATGNKKIKPKIIGIEEYEGKGISYCAICDGFFYKNKNVAVLGAGKFALNEAKVLQNIANNVIILTNGLEIKEKNGFEVIHKKISKICGNEKVEFVEFEDGTTLNLNGIFVANGEASGIDFAKKIGIITENNNIKVDKNMTTNVEGLFACGNVTGGLYQISKAVYEGTQAGLSATEYVNQNKK